MREKIKLFRCRVSVYPNDGSRLLEVVGFEARKPSHGEMLEALNLAKSVGLRHAYFPGMGGYVHECDTCGVPVVIENANYSVRCLWCSEMIAMATIKRAEMRMDGTEFGLSAADINIRAQMCERLGVIMLAMAEDFRKMSPTETDTTFVLEDAPAAQRCTAHPLCINAPGHWSVCQQACVVCAGRGCVGGTTDHEGRHPGECDGAECQACRGSGRLTLTGGLEEFDVEN